MYNRFGKVLLIGAMTLFSLAGCASIKTDVNPALKPIANTVLEVKPNSGKSAFFRPAQPEPYAGILKQKFKELEFGIDNNLRTLEIARLSNKQSLIPQISPGASLGTNNELNLRITQVLYDGGTYSAKFKEDDRLAVLRQIEFLRDLNKKASDDIAIFLSYRKNVELGQILNEKSVHLVDLLKIAKTRANGGVGDASDVSLFELKLSEIRTDAQIALADAKSDLVALRRERIDEAAADFNIGDAHMSLDVLYAIATHEHAQSKLELAKKERNPKLILEGRIGMDPFFGTPQSNVGVSVDNEQIALGGNTNVQFAQQKVELERHNLEMAIRDAQRETDRIKARLEALQSQLAQTASLSEQSSARFKDFLKQFKAGTAELSESAGLVQTLRQSAEKTVTLKYQIFDLQRQLAEQGGHFWRLAP